LPKYTYRCGRCDDFFETFHSIKTLLTDCERCAELHALTGSLERIPGSILGFKNKNIHGEIVKEHIRDTKEEVKRYKQQLRTRSIPDGD